MQTRPDFKRSKIKRKRLIFFNKTIGLKKLFDKTILVFIGQ